MEGGRQFSGFQAAYDISVHNFWNSGFFENFQQIYFLNFERKKTIFKDLGPKPDFPSLRFIEK